ncbi:MAG: S-layer homology domain-containing protein [Pseudomonadota bacterium]|nr:S-layer homology domain-containing protein [Pseudomonadota bacterium]
MQRDSSARAAEGFSDVPPDHWACSFVMNLKSSGVTDGCGGDNYCPNGIVTRSQIAVLLVKALKGADFVPPAPTGLFNDVPSASPFAPWIEQLAAEGITEGCGNNNYCPDDTVTRAQMAVFIIKAIKGPGFVLPAATGLFIDVPSTSPYAPWVEQLATDGLTEGCGNSVFCPHEVMTRAQLAVFVARAFGLNVAPTVPTLVAATSATSDELTLEWIPAVDNHTPGHLIQYEIHLSTTEGFQPATSTLVDTVTGANHATIDGLTPQTEYFAMLAVLDDEGNTSWSNQLAATTSATAAVRTATTTIVCGWCAAESGWREGSTEGSRLQCMAAMCAQEARNLAGAAIRGPSSG